MNDDYKARVDRGEYREPPAGTWYRQSVTDRWGRPGPLLEEMIAGGKALPWASRAHRRDAMSAIRALALETEVSMALQAWVGTSGEIQRDHAPILQYTDGTAPVFFRARACWGEAGCNQGFWLPALAAIVKRWKEGPPNIPFANATAQLFWVKNCSAVEALAREQESGLDLDAARTAIRSSLCLEAD